MVTSNQCVDDSDMLILNECLLESLGFFTRQELDRISLTCRLFNELSQHHFSQIPQRFLFLPGDEECSTFLKIRQSEKEMLWVVP